MRRWLAIGVIGTFTLQAAAATLMRHSHGTAGQVQAPGLPPLKAHPVVALTFDDLPAAGGLDPGDTRTRIATALAAELRAHHLKGVYGFVNAVALPGDPDSQEALRVWLGAGMNIGNHTWSHPALDDVTATDYEHDIALNEPSLASYAKGRDWHWFRYPYLEEGDTLEKHEAVRAWLDQHHYRVAEVTLNFNDDDWQDPYGRCLVKHDRAAIAWLKQSYLQNAAEFLRVGREEELIAFGHEIPNVLLLHETAFTTLMLPDLLKLLDEQGFRFTKLSKVARNPIFSKDFAAGVKGGGSLPDLYLNARRLAYPPFVPEPSARLASLCQ
jgi:peptidoglycan/xylan/chitin deacetylase (PgdA/CDA1 family)